MSIAFIIGTGLLMIICYVAGYNIGKNENNRFSKLREEMDEIKQQLEEKDN